MAKIINAKIDLSKIDKSKIFEGKKGKYYDIDIMINDEPDQYGNTVSIATRQSKEERKANEKKVFLGNGKVVWEGEGKKSAPAANTPEPEDDLPF